MSNQDDINYYYQAVNTANVLASWLYNNHRLFMHADEQYVPNAFKLWPDLLLISPPGIMHRLPIHPPSRYGQWWFGIEAWIRHIRMWSPRRGIALTSEDLGRLAGVLGLRALPTEVRTERPEPTPAPPPTVEEFFALLRDLPERLQQIEERLRRLETMQSNISRVS